MHVLHEKKTNQRICGSFEKGSGKEGKTKPQEDKGSRKKVEGGGGCVGEGDKDVSIWRKLEGPKPVAARKKTGS